VSYWKVVGAVATAAVGVATVLQTIGTFGVKWEQVADALWPVGLLAATTILSVLVVGGLIVERSRMADVSEAPTATAPVPIATGLTGAGLAAWWPGRSVRIRDEYDRRLQDASKCIDLIGFGQQHFRDDQKRRFKGWAASGVGVRILLLDPTFPNKTRSYAAQRDLEENVPAGSIATDVQGFLREVRNQGLANDPHFKVRLYRCIPTLNIFRIDDDLFWGPYLVREVSRNSPTFLLRRGPLFDRFVEHFDRIWQDPDLSRDVDWERDA
jgi:hypothetical protein